MREIFTHRGLRLCEICVFIGVFELASRVLNKFSKQVDSVNRSFKVRELFTEKTKKQQTV
jgi:hypothetical protein